MLKGQAVWLEEGHTLQLIHEPVSATIPIEEETILESLDKMKDEITCPPNKRATKPDEARPITDASMLPPAETDSLLLYKAQQNVKDKKKVNQHIIAFLLAWPVLGMFWNAFVERTAHPSWGRIASGIGRIEGYIPSNARWEANRTIDLIRQHLYWSYVPPLWYVMMGIMLAWFGWIVARVIQVDVKPWLERRRVKKSKPDPVLQEYHRLKDME